LSAFFNLFQCPTLDTEPKGGFYPVGEKIGEFSTRKIKSPTGQKSMAKWGQVRGVVEENMEGKGVS
jgi:hypothetical protein